MLPRILKWPRFTVCLKIISKKLTAFVFGKTYLHQNFTEYMSNQYAHFDISTCQLTASYGRPFDFIAFVLSQIVCLINVQVLVCQHAKCDCRL